MLKFTLLFAFVYVCVYWLHQPLNEYSLDDMLEMMQEPALEQNIPQKIEDSLQVAAHSSATSNLLFSLTPE